MQKKYIVCVDDDKQVLVSLKQELQAGLQGEFSFEIAESGEEGLELVEDLLEDGDLIPVIISDQLMPGMKGDEFLVKVQEINPNIRKILLTGQASANAVGNALNKAQLYRYIAKPWDPEDLLNTVKEAAKSFMMDKRLENQIRLQKKINHYMRLMQEHISLDALLKNLKEQLVEDVPATRACIAIQSNGSKQPEKIYQISKNGKGFKHSTLDYEQLSKDYPLTVVTEALVNHNRTTADNALATEPYANDAVVEEQQIRSIYACPIMKKDTRLGMLYVENALKTKQFDEDIQSLLDAIVNQLALAVDHILLYEDLERQVIQRTEGIRESHSDTQDSIKYAYRIQQSILPSPTRFQRALPESFVLYKPKDIVSGDFYWLSQQPEATYLVVADCTGHGVPGAFMSVLGVNLLNQIVNERGLSDPGHILTNLHWGVREMLDNEGAESELQDGMDLILVKLSAESNTLHYAGAQRPLLHLSEGKATSLKTDKLSIGAKDTGQQREDHQKLFATKSLKLKAEDAIYLFSDGVTDQFGTDNRKKFTLKRLKELLLAGSSLAMEQQQQLVANRLEIWQGDETPQTDDILLVGFAVAEGLAALNS